MRNVMISSPSYDGKASVWHITALCETVKIGLTKDINIFPIYMSFDSLVQRARNDIIKLAIELDVDDLIFIDTDQDWIPTDLFCLLEHEVDIVGCPVPNKSDNESYNIKLTKEYKVLENGLVEVDSVGTGFMRLTKKALNDLWDNAPKYTNQDDIECRMVFDIQIIDNILYSEDVSMCNTWRSFSDNHKIYIDPTINSSHSGEKRWTGDFQSWISNILGETYDEV